jgi:hypothetical protein
MKTGTGSSLANIKEQSNVYISKQIQGRKYSNKVL